MTVCNRTLRLGGSCKEKMLVNVHTKKQLQHIHC